jgi:flagellar motor switch protein FliM
MRTATNLLSREEIDALAMGINDGSIPVDTGYNTGVSIRKHDLTNEDSSLGVNVSSLDMINERFIRLFRLALLEVLRTSPKINPTRVQLVKFGDYMKDLSPPLSVNVIRMNPLRGNGMVLIDPNVIFTSLDNFFGGVGRGIGPLAPGRLFTPTETRVINLILDVFFNALKEAWAPLLTLEFETVSSEINPHFAQIADENDLVIVNHFDAECGDNHGFLDVVYPYSALKPIRELLRSRMASNDGDEASDNRWHTELTSATGDAKLEIRVLIGTVTTALSKLESLKEGDLLFFKKTDYARVNIADIPVFEARIGASGPNRAIKIEKCLEPSPEA